jgi:hypothetical protein
MTEHGPLRAARRRRKPCKSVLVDHDRPARPDRAYDSTAARKAAPSSSVRSSITISSCGRSGRARRSSSSTESSRCSCGLFGPCVDTAPMYAVPVSRRSTSRIARRSPTQLCSSRTGVPHGRRSGPVDSDPRVGDRASASIRGVFSSRPSRARSGTTSSARRVRADAPADDAASFVEQQRREAVSSSYPRAW